MKMMSKAFYPNTSIYKSIILKENDKKSGIYKWNNLITGKFYIGSAINLTKRLRDYYLPERLNKKLLKSKSLIYSSILKYGYANFSLEILEYCEPYSLIEREQYYINLLKPTYNICKIAGSTFGKKHTSNTILKIKAYKHSPEDIEKMKIKSKGRKHTLETIEKIKIKLKGRKHSSETITKLKLLSKGSLTTVTNVKDLSVKKYFSVREAAKNLGVCTKTIYNYRKTGKLLKNIYIITINSKC